ncbi:hypothetical protein Tco_0160630, partial [Tanacetum coccineum]
MAQMLQAPIEGYEDAIVVPPINANNFELKQTLINLVQSNQFTGRQDPHNHLQFFNKVTSTFRHPEVPNTSIMLLLFPFSLEDDLIPPGVENNDFEDEDNEFPNLDHQDDPLIPRPPPEPPDVEKCFEPGVGILITKVFKGVSK